MGREDLIQSPGPMPRFTIEDAAWKPTGEYMNDPCARLSTTIMLNDVCMRIEAYELKPNPNSQELRDPDADSALGHLVGDAGFPIRCHTINGREYFVMMSPGGM